MLPSLVAKLEVCTGTFQAASLHFASAQESPRLARKSSIGVTPSPHQGFGSLQRLSRRTWHLNPEYAESFSSAGAKVPQTQQEARGRSVNNTARPLDIRLDQEPEGNESDEHTGLTDSPSLYSLYDQNQSARSSNFNKYL